MRKLNNLPLMKRFLPSPYLLYLLCGSLGIVPTRNCTHLRALFLLYPPMQWNKSEKERKIVVKKLSFMHTKRFNPFFKRWVQFRVGAILPFISGSGWGRIYCWDEH